MPILNIQVKVEDNKVVGPETTSQRKKKKLMAKQDAEKNNF